MRQDFEGTAESTGLPLGNEDRQALRSMGWKSSDEESKGEEQS